jgi:Glycosyl hydrolases family 35
MESRKAAQFSYQRAKVRVAEDKQGFPSFWNFGGQAIRVSYDARSILLNEERVLLLGGSMHPSRATAQTWEAALDEAVHQGLNLITMYVIWAEHQTSMHRPVDWTLRGEVPCTTKDSDKRDTCQWNLGQAIRSAANRGLLVHIRLGPYVCAEYSYGGIPEWLPLLYPNMSLRRPNAEWMRVMSDFVTQATTYLKDQRLFSYQGGPIILAQIENEIGDSDVDEAAENPMQVDLDGNFVDPSSEQRKLDGIDSRLRNATLQDYAEWCGTLAQNLVPFVVWTMCSGLSANNTVATYNGFFDDVGWTKRHGESGRILLDQPAMWTEAEGMFRGRNTATMVQLPC